MGLITFYGIYQVIRGQMTLGTFTAIMVYFTQLIGLQGHFASFFQTFMLGVVSCRRVSEVLDEEQQVLETEDAQKVIFKTPKIAFNNVSFGYRPGEHVLKNINLNIEDGSYFAIVGPSGCGKTTILNLVLRLYDPWEGWISIDGYNIRDLRLDCLKGQIGIALQEPFLWNDTIANNIRYGKENTTDNDISRVARITGIDEFVTYLFGGYYTIIGENACKISEGQKQRIAIARALIREPKILILDEAMSSMDSASEKNIIQYKASTERFDNNHRISPFIYSNGCGFGLLF